MESVLLDRIRKLNEILKLTAIEAVSFEELTNELSKILKVNVYISEIDGTILAYSTSDEYKCDLTYYSNEETHFPENFTKKLLSYTDTVENVYEQSPVCTFGSQGPCVYKDRYMTIVPINGLGERIGTLLFCKYGGKFVDDEIILCEYSAAIVVMELLRYIQDQKKKNNADVAAAKMALSTLSYSEIEAVKMIFDEVEGEGLVVASKIATEARITRSVVSNALRKLESAGIIETRSLGMKGTYIKIVNEELRNQLAI
ncbi:GTP-sensing pleiotropic transcriptional regulator CodY [Anaerofustis sp.]|uniref:GTP-sensing pleiotropic transcriptional regulator CodY n=1 Tax=Anaerofustis sp. TaxID=1872517 RepID=UPI0025C5FF37|nr:GTP-sensing pleiotropic transcriptional regulator CodY [Anaerofustis sp.]